MAGNLGGYEKIVHYAHVLHGPMKLIALAGVAGYGILRVVEFGATKAVEKIKASKEDEKPYPEDSLSDQKENQKV